MDQFTTPDDMAIRWPPQYHPKVCAVHVRNALWIPAPADRIWAWLVRAPLWPTWYDNAAELTMLDGAGWCDLAKGIRFRWHTFGVDIESQVLEFEPCERVAWDAHGFGVNAYHAWLIQPGAGGCHVLTEETQHGFGAALMDAALPHKMSDGHDLWLKSLCLKATVAAPPKL